MARIPKAVLDHFRGVPLFAHVSARDLRAIVSAADELAEPAGTVLIREGSHRRELFVIISGTADASHGDRRVRTMGPGDFFGEISLLSGGPRTATVTATSDVTVMMLSPGQFQTVLDSEPEIRAAVLHALGERLRADEATSLES